MEDAMKKIFLILAIVILAISCKKKEEEKDFLPLNVGNYWSYKGWIIENGDTTLIDNFKMEIIDQKKDTFYHTGSLFTFEDLAEDETTKIYIADSLYLTYFYDEPDTQLVLPLKKGKEWQVNDEFKAEVIDEEDVIIGNERYTNCWRIRYENEDGDIQKDLWFKEGIGIVKFQRMENGETIILELKEYNLKK